MIGRTESKLKSLTFELLATTLIGVALIGPAAAQAPAPRIAEPMPSELSELQEGPTNFQTLLPLLLTSPDRKHLAAQLEAAIRKGDMKTAENNLNAAIEIGTLAIVLADHLRDPDFLAALQSLGIQNDAAATGTAAAAGTCTTAAAPVAANLTDMQLALEREKSFSDMVSQTLAELMQQHDTLAARMEAQTEAPTNEVAEIRQTLQQEQEKSEKALRDVEQARTEYRALQAAREQDRTAHATRSSELEALLRQEQERSGNTARELADARKDVQALQTFKDKAASQSARVAELQQALTRAEMRGEMLTQELVEAADELRTLQETRRPSATTVSDSRSASPSLTAARPQQEPTMVLVASLPEGVEPLPLPAMSPEPQSGSPVAPATSAGPRAEAPAAADRLTTRAEELLRAKDVSGARLLLERALANGNARAAFLLAETFDPNVLSRLGVFGIRGDAAKARDLYGQARAMGIAQAGERLEALKQP